MEALSRKLQAVGVSVSSVKSLIATHQSVLDQIRVEFDTVVPRIYDEACAVNGTEELSMPRIVGMQIHCDNVEVEAASQCHQCSIFLSYIDGLSNSLRKRFNNNPSFFALLSYLAFEPPNQRQ